MRIKTQRIIFIVSHGLDQICRISSIGFLALMIILVLFQVLARYIFQTVPVWTEEAARYCMVWGGLLGATISFKTNYDPRLIQPPKTGSKYWLALATHLRGIATIIFLSPILYHSNRFIARSIHRTSEGLEIPMVFIVAAVPVSAMIILIHLSARILGAEESNSSRNARK